MAIAMYGIVRMLYMTREHLPSLLVQVVRAILVSTDVNRAVDSCPGYRQFTVEQKLTTSRQRHFRGQTSISLSLILRFVARLTVITLPTRALSVKPRTPVPINLTSPRICRFNLNRHSDQSGSKHVTIYYGIWQLPCMIAHVAWPIED